MEQFSDSMKDQLATLKTMDENGATL
jgi:uncharacterized protein YnzC (UPF0291/DUF896 family)